MNTSNDFPKYHLTVDGNGQFLAFDRSAMAYALEYSHVELGRIVLNEDFTTRQITADEQKRITDAADAISRSK